MPRKRTILMPLGIASAVAIALVVAWRARFGTPQAHAQVGSATAASALAATDNPEDEGQPAALQVKTIRPKLNDKNFSRKITQPVYINAFYTADLLSHVAGEVKFIQKNIGDTVSAGEVLVRLDVPELSQDVIQKQALVKQATQDLRAAESAVSVAEAFEKQAKAMIAEKKADVDRAVATKRFRRSEYDRFKQLAGTEAVVGAVVDERLRDSESADANAKSAEISVDAASASWEEAVARTGAARVDVEVKQAKIEVAQADLGRAQAMLAYAEIKAPFAGMIIARHVDPGDFVQNASSGKTNPVLSVVKTDIVTAVMWVPEKDAPYVTKETEAVIRLDALGDRKIRGHITRLSNWLDPQHARDMRVEVDLHNLPDRVEPVTADKPAPPEGQYVAGLLRPGMYGSMTLLLQKFTHTYLVPAAAVFERGKKSCIIEVRDGVAHVVPVRILLEDGVQAKIAKIVPSQKGSASGEMEKLEDLAGSEELIRGGQGEIADGQQVQTTEVSW